MKAISFILSVYLLLLMGTPCCEFDICGEPPALGAGDHQDGKEDNCGNCSPFFACSGCISSAFATESMDFQTVISVTRTPYTGYIVSSTPEVHYDFWQPPRIG